MPDIEIDGEHWTISPHAEMRMLERGVSNNQLRQTIATPESTGQDFKGNTIYRRTFTIRQRQTLVRVIADEEYKHIITVTVDEV